MEPEEFAQRIRDIEQYIQGQVRLNFASFFLYQGSCIDTTRPFCRQLSNRVWHRAELEEFGALGLREPWKGMRKGTNPKTIFLFVGGYNCRHILVPLAKRDVPLSDLERMRAKGLVP